MSQGGSLTVGVDIGTTSVKAVAVDADGTVVDRVRVPHPVLASGPGRFEHDADRAWRRGPRQAFRQLAALDPAAVAVTTMVPSLAPVTRRGRPLGPGLLYGDDRGRDPETGAGAAADSEEAANFLRWLVAAYPDAAGYWPAAALANHALGGEGVTDLATAFTMGSLLGRDGWSEEACAAAGTVPSRLPRIGGMGDAIGRVRGADTLLASGAVDGYCEQLVAGAVEVGDVLVLCGTTLIMWVVGAEHVEVPGLWSVPHCVPGRWLMGGASNAGGLFLGWADRLLDPRAGSEAVVPGDVPVWVPYIRGERTPWTDSSLRASLHGLHVGHGPDHLRRASWEAAGFVVRHHLDLVLEQAAIVPRRVIATGGGTRVAGWMQALADVIDLPVHVAADPEGAARGAAYLARMAAGLDSGDGVAGAQAWARAGHVVDPQPRWTQPVAERYQRFRALADTHHEPRDEDR